MKRIPTAELLDSDSGTPEEISSSLDDLLSINRKFGGVSTTSWMVEHIAKKLGKSHLSLLEVAAGSGEVMQLVANQLRAHSIQLQVTLLDRAQSHLRNGFRAVAADALALP